MSHDGLEIETVLQDARAATLEPDAPYAIQSRQTGRHAQEVLGSRGREVEVYVRVHHQVHEVAARGSQPADGGAQLPQPYQAEKLVSLPPQCAQSVFGAAGVQHASNPQRRRIRPCSGRLPGVNREYPRSPHSGQPAHLAGPGPSGHHPSHGTSSPGQTSTSFTGAGG